MKSCHNSLLRHDPNFLDKNDYLANPSFAIAAFYYSAKIHWEFKREIKEW